MNSLRALFESFFSDLGLGTAASGQLTFWCQLVSLALMSLLAGYLCHRLLTPVIRHIVDRTDTKIDDYFLNPPVLRALWHVIPGLLFCILLPSLYTEATSETTVRIVNGATQVYITITFVRLIVTFLTNIAAFTTEQERFKDRHVVGVIQFLKLVTYFVGTIVVVAFLLGRNPGGLIAGLGAAATVLMFVFKDTVMGLVAGIQLSINKMLKPGDWITLEKWGINGIVEEVTLTTVKVRNFDNTISTVPPYTLVSESFQNWAGMKNRGARRVKRALSIDVSSVHLADPAEMADWEAKGLLPEADGQATDQPTNLTLFRHYAEAYLRGRTDVLQEEDWQWVMARQLEPTVTGLPIEFWFYLSETNFPRYENLAATVMEHFVAMAPSFGLRIYQAPSGNDLAAWKG